MNETVLYDYWLASADGIGLKTFLKLRDAGLSSYDLYQMTALELDSLHKDGLLDARAVLSLKQKLHADIQKDYEKLQNKQIKVLFPWDSSYPNRLLRIPDPPLTLFLRGTLPPQDSLSVAIVGARCCSSYGAYVARELGKALALEQISVVSGMATGIDGISQKSALDAEGAVFAVLGCSIDICYPQGNKALYQGLWDSKKCGILSEYRPTTEPKPSLFPPRNRIISGLSDVVVVIEAKLKSGTLITVDMALEQGKEVYALPGRITDRLSDGCNRLLKDGANILLSPEHFIESITRDILPLIKERSTSEACPLTPKFSRSHASDYNSLVQKQGSIPDSLTPLQELIYVNLEQTPITLEQLCERVQIQDISLILFELTNLQILGYIEQHGNYFRRV